MRTRLVVSAFLFAALSAPALARTAPSPFADKPLATPGIHVDDAQQWTAQDLLLQAADGNGGMQRRRIGSIRFAPGIALDVETLDSQIHWPYFFELIRAGSPAGARQVLLKLPVMDLGDTEWYFPGNGFAYANSIQWGLCGPRTTRKFALSGGVLAEVQQPILALDATSEVMETMALYDAPQGTRVVATVPRGAHVQVIGLQPGKVDDTDGPLLVRTPLGLLGWHRRNQGAIHPVEGHLDLYDCN